MIEVVVNYDCHINDIPGTHIEQVNWSTVPHSDFETIKDEYLRLAPLYRVYENRKIDTIKDDIVLEIIKNELAEFTYKSNKNSCDDLDLSDVLSCFLTREFVSNNKDELSKMFNKKRYLINLQLLMASFGLYDFKSFDEKYIKEYFSTDLFKHMTSSEIYDLIENTKVLHYLSYYNDPEYIPVLLNSKELSELKLYNFDDLYVLDLTGCSLSWDEWLDKYYANDVDFDLISDAYQQFACQCESSQNPAGFQSKGY